MFVSSDAVSNGTHSQASAGASALAAAEPLETRPRLVVHAVAQAAGPLLAVDDHLEFGEKGR